MDEEQKYRITCIKTAFLSIGICYLVGNWIATQCVAADCLYNDALGGYLHLGDMHIYAPYKYYVWTHDEFIKEAIPGILSRYGKYTMLSFLASLIFTYFYCRGLKKHTSHGSASFADAKEIIETGLGEFNEEKIKTKFLGIIPVEKTIKKVKNSGVVVGINPFTHKLMLHDGPEHMLLMAPTRSGKGVNTIIPTGLIWKHSIFFFDVKGELWQATAGYRQKVMKQKVMKFEPLCTDGSAARWNPLAEINFRTTEELSDVSTIVGMMVKPDGEKQGGGDPFWDNSAAALLNGVIMHLLYSYYKENRDLPCPTDIMSFLSSPDMDTDDLFESMKNYAHITPNEFLEKEYVDKNGKTQKYKNPLKEIYGEYIKNFRAFSKALKRPVHSIEDIRLAILDSTEGIDFDTTDDDDIPYHLLLTHPKVAECASNMLNGAEQTRASIMQTAQTALAIYQDPVVQKNTAVSDFCIRDLLDPRQEVSMYLVMQVKDIATLKPLSRLFINTMLSKLIRDMKFEKEPNKKKEKKQRLLLMLDEFPQLGQLKAMEMALAVCAGYGIKVCIVAQDVNQLNKAYTKDNSIASNCHVHIYFTPNLDSGSATAEAISKNLGKQTITTVSHSDGGGGFLKGSNSKSFTSRELMTPDEVSHMSSEKELVFVAGHKAILGDKLRYYLQPFFTKRTLIPEPLYSDKATQILNFVDLFGVHAADVLEKKAKFKAVAEAKIKANANDITKNTIKNNTSKERITNEKELPDCNEDDKNLVSKEQYSPNDDQPEYPKQDIKSPRGASKSEITDKYLNDIENSGNYLDREDILNDFCSELNEKENL